MQGQRAQFRLSRSLASSTVLFLRIFFIPEKPDDGGGKRPGMCWKDFFTLPIKRCFMENGERRVGRTPDILSGKENPATALGQGPASADMLEVSEEVILLEPGKENAQNIVKAISNQNASEVLQLLSRDGPLRLSDIAERLGMSLNATKYHIENLMSAGLLEIAGTRYTVKGRKVKIYRLKNQIFIVAMKMTGTTEVRSMLLKYCAALGIFIMAFAVTLFQPFVSLPAVPLQLTGSIHPASGLPAPVMTVHGIIPALIIAAAATLILLVLYEVYAHRKTW